MQFENLSTASKVKDLWQFESNIPNLALTEFELISPVEKSDIERLFEDRSRCAHPSMTSLEEPFEATAELARYHLRSAIMHLLERPPVQGRAAKTRIFDDIKSDYFPADPELALKYLEKSPLARARLPLIKDIILGLTVSLLKDDFSKDERARQFSALIAISNMYLQETREILNNNLSNIILNKIPDANWDKIIIYLGTVTTWEFLSEPCQLKAKVFTEKLEIFEEDLWATKYQKRVLPNNIAVLAKASRISFLKEVVMKKLQLSLKDLLFLKENSSDKIFNNTIINPLLKELLPQADLQELALMRADADSVLNELIEPRLKEKIKHASLEQLFSTMSFYEDESLNRLIEDDLKEKVGQASYGELLKIRSEYYREVEDILSLELRNIFNNSIDSSIKNASFSEVIKSKYVTMIPDIFITPLVRENVSLVVNTFIGSSSYTKASFHASLLIKIVDLLEPLQWQNIFDAFCENAQINCSYDCPDIFCVLFKKSIEKNFDVMPYWLSFRKKLDKFNDRDIQKLKILIDRYDF